MDVEGYRVVGTDRIIARGSLVIKGIRILIGHQQSIQGLLGGRVAALELLH